MLVVAGPTASGKSALALMLAGKLGGAIVNADAIQVYREFSILTARPDAAEAARAPHYLYGVLSAAERGTVSRWRDMALAAIAAARAAGTPPILVGGTGLYLKAILQGLSPTPELPAQWRARAQARRAELGAAAFHAELAAVDPVLGARLAPGDTQRVIRAWEVIQATGKSLAEFQRLPGAPAPYRFIPVVLEPLRAELYAACEARCARMMDEGALEEVRAVTALGLDPGLPAMKAVGLRELAAYLAGNATREVALAAFRQATRNYAKRQVTWFRHQMPEARVWNAQYSERVGEEIFSFIRKTC